MRNNRIVSILLLLVIVISIFADLIIFKEQVYAIDKGLELSVDNVNKSYYVGEKFSVEIKWNSEKKDEVDLEDPETKEDMDIEEDKGQEDIENEDIENKNVEDENIEDENIEDEKLIEKDRKPEENLADEIKNKKNKGKLDDEGDTRVVCIYLPQELVPNIENLEKENGLGNIEFVDKVYEEQLKRVLDYLMDSDGITKIDAEKKLEKLLDEEAVGFKSTELENIINIIMDNLNIDDQKYFEGLKNTLSFTTEDLKGQISLEMKSVELGKKIIRSDFFIEDNKEFSALIELNFIERKSLLHQANNMEAGDYYSSIELMASDLPESIKNAGLLKSDIYIRDYLKLADDRINSARISKDYPQTLILTDEKNTGAQVGAAWSKDFINQGGDQSKTNNIYTGNFDVFNGRRENIDKYSKYGDGLSLSLIDMYEDMDREYISKDQDGLGIRSDKLRGASIEIRNMKREELEAEEKKSRLGFLYPQLNKMDKIFNYNKTISNGEWKGMSATYTGIDGSSTMGALEFQYDGFGNGSEGLSYDLIGNIKKGKANLKKDDEMISREGSDLLGQSARWGFTGATDDNHNNKGNTHAITLRPINKIDDERILVDANGDEYIEDIILSSNSIGLGEKIDRGYFHYIKDVKPENFESEAYIIESKANSLKRIQNGYDNTVLNLTKEKKEKVILNYDIDFKNTGIIKWDSEKRGIDKNSKTLILGHDGNLGDGSDNYNVPLANIKGELYDATSIPEFEIKIPEGFELTNLSESLKINKNGKNLSPKDIELMQKADFEYGYKEIEWNEDTRILKIKLEHDESMKVKGNKVEARPFMVMSGLSKEIVEKNSFETPSNYKIEIIADVVDLPEKNIDLSAKIKRRNIIKATSNKIKILSGRTNPSIKNLELSHLAIGAMKMDIEGIWNDEDSMYADVYVSINGDEFIKPENGEEIIGYRKIGRINKEKDKDISGDHNFKLDINKDNNFEFLSDIKNKAVDDNYPNKITTKIILMDESGNADIEKDLVITINYDNFREDYIPSAKDIPDAMKNDLIKKSDIYIRDYFRIAEDKDNIAYISEDDPTFLIMGVEGIEGYAAAWSKDIINHGGRDKNGKLNHSYTLGYDLYLGGNPTNTGRIMWTGLMEAEDNKDGDTMQTVFKQGLMTKITPGRYSQLEDIYTPLQLITKKNFFEKHSWTSHNFSYKANYRKNIDNKLGENGAVVSASTKKMMEDKYDNLLGSNNFLEDVQESENTINSRMGATYPDVRLNLKYSEAQHLGGGRMGFVSRTYGKNSEGAEQGVRLSSDYDTSMMGNKKDSYGNEYSDTKSSFRRVSDKLPESASYHKIKDVQPEIFEGSIKKKNSNFDRSTKVESGDELTLKYNIYFRDNGAIVVSDIKDNKGFSGLYSKDKEVIPENKIYDVDLIKLIENIAEGNVEHYFDETSIPELNIKLPNGFKLKKDGVNITSYKLDSELKIFDKDGKSKNFDDLISSDKNIKKIKKLDDEIYKDKHFEVRGNEIRLDLLHENMVVKKSDIEMEDNGEVEVITDFNSGSPLMDMRNDKLTPKEMKSNPAIYSISLDIVATGNYDNDLEPMKPIAMVKRRQVLKSLNNDVTIFGKSENPEITNLDTRNFELPFDMANKDMNISLKGKWKDIDSSEADLYGRIPGYSSDIKLGSVNKSKLVNGQEGMDGDFDFDVKLSEEVIRKLREITSTDKYPGSFKLLLFLKDNDNNISTEFKDIKIAFYQKTDDITFELSSIFDGDIANVGDIVSFEGNIKNNNKKEQIGKLYLKDNFKLYIEKIPDYINEAKNITNLKLIGKENVEYDEDYAKKLYEEGLNDKFEDYINYMSNFIEINKIGDKLNNYLLLPIYINGRQENDLNGSIKFEYYKVFHDSLERTDHIVLGPEEDLILKYKVKIMDYEEGDKIPGNLMSVNTLTDEELINIGEDPNKVVNTIEKRYESYARLPVEIIYKPKRYIEEMINSIKFNLSDDLVNTFVAHDDILNDSFGIIKDEYNEDWNLKARLRKQPKHTETNQVLDGIYFVDSYSIGSNKYHKFIYDDSSNNTILIRRYNSSSLDNKGITKIEDDKYILNWIPFEKEDEEGIDREGFYLRIMDKKLQGEKYPLGEYKGGEIEWILGPEIP